MPHRLVQLQSPCVTGDDEGVFGRFAPVSVGRAVAAGGLRRSGDCRGPLSSLFGFSELSVIKAVPTPPPDSSHCPLCDSPFVKAVEFPDDRVVWLTCQKCGHIWCVPRNSGSTPAR